MERNEEAEKVRKRKKMTMRNGKSEKEESAGKKKITMRNEEIYKKCPEKRREQV